MHQGGGKGAVSIFAGSLEKIVNESVDQSGFFIAGHNSGPVVVVRDTRGQLHESLSDQDVCFHDVFDIATTARTDITAQEVIDYAEGQGMAFKSASHDEAEWRQVVCHARL